jgi:hypothetical protein
MSFSNTDLFWSLAYYCKEIYIAVSWYINAAVCGFSLLKMPMELYVQEKKLTVQEVKAYQEWSHFSIMTCYVWLDIPVSALYLPSLSEA